MFASIKKLALPVISAALLLPLSGAPSPAAPTVISTAHYQTSMSLSCNGGALCNGWFPTVGARRRLTLTRVTCLMRSANYAVFASGQIEVRTVASGSVSMGQFLPIDHSTEWGFHVLNSATDLRLVGGQQFGISLFLVPDSGVTQTASCTAHGTLEVMQ